VCSGPLELLDVSSNKLQNASLCAAASSGRMLCELNFSNNRLGSTLELSSANLDNLLLLNLSRNFVPPTVAIRLFDALPRLAPRLERVEFSRQTSWTREFTDLRNVIKGAEKQLPFKVQFDPIDLETEEEIAEIEE
jgi:hypothetical protein